jgi:NAD(P)-dependent dehydrogenase (short-subunit alcohol dehydrogenase family)
MTPNTVYVITGANRGIGFGLVEAYLARPFTTVVAVVRSNTAATSLKAAAEKASKGNGSLLYTFEIDLSKVTKPESIRDRFHAATSNLSHVNTLICSAGHATPMPPTIEISAVHLRECFEVNTIAPLVMFQALWPLMSNNAIDSLSPPKFIVLSSSMGSIGAMEPFPGGAYGPSKAAINHIVKSLHMQMESNGLISVALHPGWVKTDLGNLVAKEWGYIAGPPDTVESSIRGILKVVDEATRENVSGRFVTQTSEELPW